MTYRFRMRDKVQYTRYGRTVGGWVADRIKSPLSGRIRLRVVDYHADRKDPDAGMWIYEEDAQWLENAGELEGRFSTAVFNVPTAVVAAASPRAG